MKITFLFLIYRYSKSSSSNDFNCPEMLKNAFKFDTN